MDDTYKAYGQLASAVIYQAVRDYKTTLENLERYPDDDELMSQKSREEKFFRSDWFDVLGSCIGVDGEYLMRKLREDVKHDGERILQSDTCDT